MAVSRSLHTFLPTAGSREAMSAAAAPTTPSTIVPLMPMDATGEFTEPFERPSLRPDMKRNAPFATDAPNERPVAGS